MQNVTGMIDSIIFAADSYKYSMVSQYPEGTQRVFSYIESRGGEYDKTVMFGLQYFIKKYLTKPITQREIDTAKVFFAAHGVPFYAEGWQYILDRYQGFLPLSISAIPEGTVIPTKNVLAYVFNTDDKCWWLTTHIETAILKYVWYGTTVATQSWYIKQAIRQALEDTADSVDGLDFKLHDFGFRGVSSTESAGLGGAAHLVNFKGTDTIAGILTAMEYYDSDVCGFSIPAMEHSTVTSWGQDREVEAYRNMLKQYAKPGAIIACVSDAYNIFDACEHLWGEQLKQEVIDSGAVVVIRPDSGDPETVVARCADILAEKFGYTLNSKGFKVLNNVRIIQGDGINYHSVRGILACLRVKGYSADNIAFGMGGAGLQMVHRDTLKFAMKCSAAKINDEWIDVFKDPITDPGKLSKKGCITTIHNVDTNEYKTIRMEDIDNYNTSPDSSWQVATQLVFYDGVDVNSQNFDTIRARANKG